MLVGAHKVLASGKVVELLDTLLIEERDVAVLGDELVHVRVERMYVGCDVGEAVYADEELVPVVAHALDEGGVGGRHVFENGLEVAPQLVDLDALLERGKELADVDALEDARVLASIHAHI